MSFITAIYVEKNNGLLASADSLRMRGMRSGGCAVFQPAIFAQFEFSLTCDMKGRGPSYASRCFEQCITMNSRKEMYVTVSRYNNSYE